MSNNPLLFFCLLFSTLLFISGCQKQDAFTSKKNELITNRKTKPAQAPKLPTASKAASEIATSETATMRQKTNLPSSAFVLPSLLSKAPPEPQKTLRVTAAFKKTRAAQKTIRPRSKRQLNYLLDKSFDDLTFELEVNEEFERSLLTPQIEILKGQRIRIRGYIFPTPVRQGIKQFVLVRDNQECCFGPGAALFDCIIVKMNPGKTATFSARPVTVEGRFQIKEFYLGETIRAIYQLEGEVVR